MKKVIELTKGSRLLYAIAIISIGIASFIAMIEPMIVRITIDSIIGNNPLKVPKLIESLVYALGGRETLGRNLWICSLALVGLTCARGIFLYLKGKLSAQAAENMARNIRVRLYDHIQKLPYEYHIKSESGDLIQRCTSDVDTVRKFFALQMVEIGRAVFIVTFAVIMMSSLNKKMTIIAMSVERQL